MRIIYHKYQSLIKFLLTLIVGLSAYTYGYSQKYTEYEVKAAYLYNFVKFVQWPTEAFTSPEAPFVIGIYGEDPFNDILSKAFEGRTLCGRKWIIKHYVKPEEIDDCHLLFVSPVNKYELFYILNAIKKKPILTVGDKIDGFCEMGGIIDFTKQRAKYRFQINNGAAIRVGISISSKLLSLSEIIVENEVKF